MSKPPPFWKNCSDPARRLRRRRLVLASPPPPPRSGAAPRPQSGSHPWGDWIHSAVGHVVDGVVEVTENACGGPLTDSQANSFHLSQVDSPTGERALFHGNHFRMSKVRELRLDRSEFSDNRIDASKLAEIRLVDGKFTGARIQASSLVEWRVERSEIEGLELGSCKCCEISLTDQSVLRQVRLFSSVAKEIKIAEGSIWENCAVSSAVVCELAVRRSHLLEVQFQTMRICDSALAGCEWKNVVVRGLDLDRAAFADCRFDGVVFAAGGQLSGLKKRSFAKVRFENCRLNQVLFSDCRLSHCTFRNLTLSGIDIRGRDLSGQTLDGNDAFLRATGLSAKAG